MQDAESGTLNPKYNKAERGLIIGALGACVCALLTGTVAVFWFTIGQF